MKNIIYIHGIHGDTQKSIAPYLEKEFKKLGFSTHYPKFFKDNQAYYENFKMVADDLVNRKILTNDSIIIAHSIGNSFAIRYFYENKIAPFAYISLAGYADKFPLNNELTKQQIYTALPTENQLQYLKNNVKNKISLYSNDHLVPKNLLEDFSSKIESKLYYIENKGHFGRRMGLQELPELIEIMKENKII